MILDSPTFTTNLTPEAALSVIQSEMGRKGWKDWEVEEIRLVYVPYYLFSFDVSADTAQPSGRAALNADTGELDEFVQTLLDRPLNRTKNTDSKSSPEVEPTNIARSDVERVAAVKVASSVGLKKENITISAISKYYFPFYRVWITAGGEHGNSYTINVDALLGAPLGLEAVASKKKGFDEDSAQVFQKLKSPSGWLELISSIPMAITSGQGPIAEALSSKTTRWILLAAIIVVLLLFVFKGPSVNTNCTADPGFNGPAPFLGLSIFGPQQLIPKAGVNGLRYIDLTCTYKYNSGSEATACSTAQLTVNGHETSVINSTSILMTTPNTPYYGHIRLNWNYTQTLSYPNPVYSAKITTSC